MEKHRSEQMKRELKPGALLAPLPVVMVSCADNRKNRPNIITAAWTGIVNTAPPMVSLSLKPERYSHDLIATSGEFVINLVSADLLTACDFCGVRSGRDYDKFEHCRLTPNPAAKLERAPAIAQSPLTLSCKVRSSEFLGTHTLFIAEILAIEVAENLLNEKGAIELQRADLVSYMHGSYYELGKALGFFGYSVASPAVLARRLTRSASGKKRTTAKKKSTSGNSKSATRNNRRRRQKRKPEDKKKQHP